MYVFDWVIIEYRKDGSWVMICHPFVLEWIEENWKDVMMGNIAPYVMGGI